MTNNKDTRFVVAGFSGQSWDYGMSRHPYWREEREHNAQYCVYNRRLMAVSIDSATVTEQYWRLRRMAGALHTGELPTEIRGPDATRLLNRVFPRDVGKIAVGRCSYQLACYPNGGVIVDGVLLRLAEDRFWYVQADGDFYSWLVAHSQDLDLEIFDPDIRVSQVQGPNSLKILEEAVDGTMPERFRYYDLAEVSIAGQKLIITRTGYTNELGWEFYVGPEHDPLAIWNRIKRAGAAHGLGLAALDGFEPRRIEAGILNAGSDFDHMMTPFEAGLGAIVDLTKDAFIGKAALMKCDRRRRLWGLRAEGGTPKNLGAVLAGGKRAGFVTAGAWSPYLQCGVALARMDAPTHGLGTTVEVECLDGGRVAAVICDTPMYDQARDIPRGRAKGAPDISA